MPLNPAFFFRLGEIPKNSVQHAAKIQIYEGFAVSPHVLMDEARPQLVEG
jgi:hypothetical protein